MENCADPDQTTLSGAVWAWSESLWGACLNIMDNYGKFAFVSNSTDINTKLIKCN